MLLPALLLTAAACGGGGGPQLFQPYDSCDTQNGDGCTSFGGIGFACVPTTLPPPVAFTGEFCTVGCATISDCPLAINNFDTICVNSQCYIQCPQGSQTCPYGQGCFPFTDSATGDIISLCTP
jgi:hypothetical protein